MLPHTRRSAGYLLLVLLAAVGVYLPNIRDYFIGDDFDLISSFYGKPARYFVELLYSNESGDVWKSWGIDPEHGLGFLRPLKMWVLKLDTVLWNTHPLGFHVSSTLFFAATVLFVFLILDLVVPGRPAVAFAGAWITAIHPLFSEVVPFITAREETIAASLGLCSFYLFLRQRLRGGRSFGFPLFYGLALLTKESSIAIAALALGYDLVSGRLLGRSAREVARTLRPHAVVVVMLAAYFLLRWIAFGNFKGGDAFPTSYLSPRALLVFHKLFFENLLDRTLFLAGDVPGVSWAVALSILGVLAALLVLRRRIAPTRLRELVFFGPLWYVVTTSVLFGAYFAVRRNGLALIGLAMFAALVADTLLDALRISRPERWMVAATAVATALLLPPTIENSLEVHRASATVQEMREIIEKETAGLPDGCQVFLANVPQWEVFPYYFGWALQSALKLPFTATDLAKRCTVIELRNVEMNRYATPIPDDEEYDLKLAFNPERFLSQRDRERWRTRLVRSGLIPG